MSGRTVTREQIEPREKTMQIKRPMLLVLLIGTLAAVSFGAIPSSRAATPEDLNQDADQALHKLTSTNPFAAALAKKAKAVLIFPNIVKAGVYEVVWCSATKEILQGPSLLVTTYFLKEFDDVLH
jgi:hypothetical protein